MCQFARSNDSEAGSDTGWKWDLQVVRAQEDQRMREGVLPPHLSALLQAGRAVFELKRGAKPQIGPAL